MKLSKSIGLKIKNLSGYTFKICRVEFVKSVRLYFINLSGWICKICRVDIAKSIGLNYTVY